MNKYSTHWSAIKNPIVKSLDLYDHQGKLKERPSQKKNPIFNSQRKAFHKE